MSPKVGGMSQTKLKKLTPEQEALIPVYQEKWRAIALSTGPINRSQAAETIKAAYAIIGKKAPEVIFGDRPYEAADIIVSQMDNPRNLLRSQFETKLRSELAKQLQSYLRSELESQLHRQLQNQLENQLYNGLERQFWSYQREELAGKISIKLSQQFSGQRSIKIHWETLGKQLNNCIQPELWAGCASFLDFCISVLNLPHSYGNIWNIFQSIVRDCGWIYPYDKVCVVCEKPIALSVDSNYRLHAEGKPAVQFADSFAIYAYHGVILPEWYGYFHPHQWQSKWVLKEHNAEVRRALIQGITYDRLCQQLQAVELDSWQEYTLLKIDNADVEPIYLLKMTCPSTGHIHALRVPPDVESAKEAIRWINWGIAPEEFSVQT
jgi:hypothetical protein